MNPDLSALHTYIAEQRRNGVSDGTISQTLVSSGWQADMVNAALETNPPVPQPNYPPQYQNQAVSPIETQNTRNGFFRGRLNRLGFLLVLVYYIVYFLIGLGIAYVAHGSNVLGIITVVMSLVGVLVAIPLGISIHIRRWHDIGQSGWMTLLVFIPLFGLVISLSLLFIPGTKGPNAFGARAQASLAPKDILGLRRN